jgi:MFS family permease
MYAPEAAGLRKDFHQTSSTVASLSVTLFLLGFALGQLFIAPLSELYGRLPIYLTCNAIFIIFMIACAASKDIGMFLAFRFIAGCGGSAPLTIGGGTIADVISQENRRDERQWHCMLWVH